MKKENKVTKVVKKRVGSPDSSSEVSQLVEVNILNYFFESLKNQHLKEFLISASSSDKPFIRLYDL